MCPLNIPVQRSIRACNLIKRYSRAVGPSFSLPFTLFRVAWVDVLRATEARFQFAIVSEKTQLLSDIQRREVPFVSSIDKTHLITDTIVTCKGLTLKEKFGDWCYITVSM